MNATVHEPPDDVAVGEGRLKLWQLLALISALFAAHYLLIQNTIRAELEKFRSEVSVQQARLDGVMQSDSRDTQILLQRVATLERDEETMRRELAIIKERQAVVRQKLGLRSDD